MLAQANLVVTNLGERRHRSPLCLSTTPGDGIGDFVLDEARVRYVIELPDGRSPDATQDLLFEKAGPREQIFFDPPQTNVAIVTCGGLCPGLNNVIRSLFLELHHNYGVANVWGIRYGYRGLNPREGDPPILLTPQFVENIHRQGGTVLGSSRGPQDPAVTVDFLVEHQISALFCLGGDGTQRGAEAIHQEVARRKLPIAVIGIPKTIDNDIPYVTQTFGFSTALEKAKEVIDGAHAESKGAPRGIGLVKVMGRDAGFIAAGATIASQEVNFALIPEAKFSLDGEGGLLAALAKRLDERDHAVIVVAEGAGQDLLEEETTRDASGNRKQADIGPPLAARIVRYFESIDKPVNLKYIDPSYTIRSVPANVEDSLLCNALARNAAHAAMAGKTGVMIGYWHDAYIHVPIPTAVATKKRVAPESELWMAVEACTGQPRWR
ncbi:MAG: ATP-dependent 6-phosphofructokinase [Pirellulales bacterium]|nr:ATP-dependent 6-phosphofructokinase [Pirellulales bacterium]